MDDHMTLLLTGDNDLYFWGLNQYMPMEKTKVIVKPTLFK